jgi:UDP-3-O-[3-hydroxymyristoyl] glucosamine N-acyltransferase
MRLSELASQIEAELVGDGEAEVNSLASLELAGPGQLSFLSNTKYVKQFNETKAQAVIVGKNVKSDRVTLLRCADPYYAFSRAVVLLHGYRRHPHAGVHPRANVDPAAQIGEGTVVYPGVFVGPGAKVGKDCILYPNVAIYDGCVLGDRVIVHAGTVIGADGFGYATHKGVHHKIPQIANVTIEDDVEIGANCTIARGALEDTRIGAGTKMDGLVMVGHGATLGRGCIVVAQVAIAGSVRIGNYVVIGGQAAIAGHLEIGDQAQIAGRTAVMQDVEAGATMVGMPAMPQQQARRVYLQFTRLPELAERVKGLEKRVGAEGDGNA